MLLGLVMAMLPSSSLDAGTAAVISDNCEYTQSKMNIFIDGC
jgi:hypothetical protein